MTTTDWITAGATVGLLIVATLQWIVYRRQAVIMDLQRSAIDRQARHMEDGLALTKAAADAAKESADVARHTLAMQGADVQIENTSFDVRHGLFMLATMTVNLKNFGTTSARNVAIDLMLGIPDMPIAPGEFANPPVSIAAGQTYSYGFRPLREILDMDALHRIDKGTAPLKLWGTVRYEDVFGNHHELTYSSVWIHNTSAFSLETQRHHLKPTMAG